MSDDKTAHGKTGVTDARFNESINRNHHSILTDRKEPDRPPVEIFHQRSRRNPRLKLPLRGFKAFFFGLPFLIGGMVVVSLGLSSWITYYTSQHWQKIPCTIQQVQLHRHRNTESTTYSVSVLYSYEFQGRPYQGSRVSLNPGSSSDFSFHQSIYQELLAYKTSARSFSVYVNPQNPEQSLLYRRMGTFGFILLPFGLVFSLAGLFIIGSGLLSRLKQRRYLRMQREYPEAPWKRYHCWKGNKFITSGGRKVLETWAFTSFGILFLSIFTGIFLSGGTPIFLKVILALFFFLGLGLVGFAVYKTLQYFRWGNSTLIFDQIPTPPGSHLKGRVLINKYCDDTDFSIRLLCSEDRIVEKRSGGSRTTTIIRRDLSEDRFREFGHTDGSGNTVISLSIPIPEGLPDTTEIWEPERVSIYWQLEVVGRVSGIDFRGVYDIPVFSVKKLADDTP